MSNKTAKMSSNIAENWEALSGKNNWKGLVEPLDIELRRYLIHYGERAGAIADGFVSEKKSKNCGLARYPPETMFAGVGLDKGNPFKYQVMRYIYAAYPLKPDSEKAFVMSEAPDALERHSNVIGYVAVATDEGKVVLGRRDILVVWRGTILDGDKTADLDIAKVSGSNIIGSDHNPMIHRGWYTLYMNTNSSPYNRTSARDQVFAEVKKLVSQYREEEMSISVAGHSMGAAIATLNAVDMAYNKLNSRSNESPFLLTAFAYASPRIGDGGFASVFSDLRASGGLRVLRISEVHDLVPNLPPNVFSYSDVGEVLQIDVTNSPYIKPIASPYLSVHELELYLHDLAGTKGIDKGFDLVVDRDISLVNKNGDFIKDEYKVVDKWWTEKNKSMTQGADGKWVLDDDWPELY